MVRAMSIILIGYGEKLMYLSLVSGDELMLPLGEIRFSLWPTKSNLDCVYSVVIWVLIQVFKLEPRCMFMVDLFCVFLWTLLLHWELFLPPYFLNTTFFWKYDFKWKIYIFLSEFINLKRKNGAFSNKSCLVNTSSIHFISWWRSCSYSQRKKIKKVWSQSKM